MGLDLLCAMASLNIGNIWYNITQWFRDRQERRSLITSFNEAARNSYIFGEVPTLLTASVSRGNSKFKHSLSKLNSGFRIKVFAGKSLDKQELRVIGAAVMSDPALMRRLVVLGFDTLEVYGEGDAYGLCWQIKDFLQLTNGF